MSTLHLICFNQNVNCSTAVFWEQKMIFGFDIREAWNYLFWGYIIWFLIYGVICGILLYLDYKKYLKKIRTKLLSYSKMTKNQKVKLENGNNQIEKILVKYYKQAKWIAELETDYILLVLFFLLLIFLLFGHFVFGPILSFFF